MRKMNGFCPVCMVQFFKNDFDICEICSWQNDPVQFRYPNETKCSNTMSVSQAIIARKAGLKELIRDNSPLILDADICGNKFRFTALDEFYLPCHLYNDMLDYAIVGLATGDATGVPYEFLSREELSQNPATGMTGLGTHHQLLGTWSDDTSMTLALIDALTKSEDDINYTLIAENFVDWLENAAFTARKEVFDVGGTCLKAIRRHMEYPDLPAWDCGEKSEHACGNGALMRILPLAFWLSFKYGEHFIKIREAREEIRKVTAITHGNACCVLANLIYVTFAGRLFCLEDKDVAWSYTLENIKSIIAADSWLQTATNNFARLLSEDFPATPIAELSGSGYVVHTLESAVWCFMNTHSYQSCVLEAVNLGEDTDTTAAVAGGLAGLYYSKYRMGEVPRRWMSATANSGDIFRMCDEFYERIERFLE